MNWLKKLVAKLFGIGHVRPVPVDRPAKSVAFEASAQKVVDEHRLNDPWEAAAESIRRNRMFDDSPANTTLPKSAKMRVIGAVNHLPYDTSVEQFLALHKDPQEYDTIFIGNHYWVWMHGKWNDIGRLATAGRAETAAINQALQDKLNWQRSKPARNTAPAASRDRIARDDHDPLLDTFIVTQAITSDSPHRSSSSRQDHHRYEDTPSHTPTHHSAPSHSHSHDNSRNDDGGNYDSGGSDSGGSSD